MPRPKQHRVVLDQQQKQRLQELISKGKASARVIRRAHVLLLAAEDQEDKVVQAYTLTRKRSTSSGNVLEQQVWRPRFTTSLGLEARPNSMVSRRRC
jgi:hypothetical protein